MLNLKSFIVEEKNTHMQHVEELMFLGGVDGTRQAINFLRDLRDMLRGNSTSAVDITVKWDGCIHEDTIVLTNAGDMTIKEVVKRCQWDDNLMVMGKELGSPLQYDHMVHILAGMSQEGEKAWVEIELEDGSKLKMTEDHEVHTSNRGWVKAGELTEEDDVTEL
jgi:hypothetical protein